MRSSNGSWRRRGRDETRTGFDKTGASMIWPFQKDPIEEPWNRIDWDNSFARQITTTDDKTLCERFAVLVGQERVHASLDEDEPDVCAFLVWRAKGPLDSGFGCLLGFDDPPVDPHLLHTRRAFEIIGL